MRLFQRPKCDVLLIKMVPMTILGVFKTIFVKNQYIFITRAKVWRKITRATFKQHHQTWLVVHDKCAHQAAYACTVAIIHACNMATSFACTTAMMLTCISLITCMHCGHGKCMYYDHGASKYCCQIKLTYDGRNTLVYDGHNTWPRYILIMAEACAGTVAMCMDVLWRTYMYYYVT